MEEVKKRTQLSLENELRDELAEEILHLMEEKYGEAYKVGATDTGLAYRIGSPCVDADHNEKTVLVSISIPRGYKDGRSYDLYEAKDEYEIRVQAAAEEAKAREEKKAREEAEKKRKLEARRAKKVAKKASEQK